MQTDKGTPTVKPGGELRAMFAPANVVSLPVWQDGNVFRVDNAYFVPSDNPGTFTLRVNNASGDWISVDIDRSGGVASTNHIEKNQSGGFSEAIQLYVERPNKVTRWRPGVFGVPGNGGGEVWFEVPASNGSAYLEITVTG